MGPGRVQEPGRVQFDRNMLEALVWHRAETRGLRETRESGRRHDPVRGMSMSRVRDLG